MKLYTQHRNSAGQRIRITLALKGIDYDYVAVGALGREAYTKVNPQGLMPALAVDGVVIAQSTTIFEYLDERFPEPPLLPGDLLQRAQARAIAHHVAADMHPVTVNRVRKYLAVQLNAGEDDVEAYVAHWTGVGFSAIETMLADLDAPNGDGFCFGAGPTIAEIFLVPHLQTARRLGVDPAPYPRALALEAACMTLPAFVAALPENQPDYPG
jgi:maleylacetoacetate isomerase